jgi:hypothetical protein
MERSGGRRWNVAKLEVGLLSLIFDLHPKHLTATELVHARSVAL